MKSNGKRLGFMGDFTLANPRNGLGLVDPNFSLPWLFLSHGFALQLGTKIFHLTWCLFKPKPSTFPPISLQFFLPFFWLTHGRTHLHLGAPKFLLVAWLVISHHSWPLTNFSTKIFSSFSSFPHSATLEKWVSIFFFSTSSWFLA